MAKTILTYLIVVQLLSGTNIYSQGWEQIYDFEDFNFGIGIYNSQAGGFALFSHSLNYDSPEQFIQVDADGKILKNVEYNKLLNTFYIAFRATCSLNSGDFIVAGELQHEILDPVNAFLMKIDPSGQVVWLHEFLGEKSYSVKAVSEVSNGDLILTGFISTSGQQD